MNSKHLIKWKEDPREFYHGFGIVHSMGKYLVGSGSWYPDSESFNRIYNQERVLKTCDTWEEAVKELQSLINLAQNQIDD